MKYISLLLVLLLIGSCRLEQNKRKKSTGENSRHHASSEEQNEQKSSENKKIVHQATDDSSEYRKNHKPAHEGSHESQGVEKKCKLRDLGEGRKVCVCNSEYCDTIPRPRKPGKSEFILYTSNKEGLRFHKTTGRFQKKDSSKKSENDVYVNPDQRYQNVLGWGGAFTDSTGINIRSLDKPAQDLIIKSYFSEEGIEYSLCRVPIGSTDFSIRNYTYDDSKTPDKDLKHFALASEDYEYKIPLMKQAIKLRKGLLKFFGSTWAAPKWMKTNNEYYGYGFIKKEFYQTWAEYFVRFLEEYHKNGVPIWGITTQNEPTMAIFKTKDLPTVGWISANLSVWIKENLGPTIKKSKFPNTVIMALDDQKLLLPWYMNSVFEDKNASKYVHGIAIHWYLGVFTPCSALNITHNKYPAKFILSTEACSGFQTSSGILLGSWERGEGYSLDIIENLNCWVVGWIDWNMVLSMDGGPTTIKNYVDSPIIVNKKSAEFYKQPMYYHLGHHSKFVPTDSTRIGVTQRIGKRMWVTAYQRPDGGIVVVILNKNNEDVRVRIVDRKVGVSILTISKRSINTILYWRD